MSTVNATAGDTSNTLIEIGDVNVAYERTTDLFGCSECPKQYRNAQSAARHHREKHGRSYDKLVCNRCGRDFLRKDGLKRHVRDRCKAKRHGLQTLTPNGTPEQPLDTPSSYHGSLLSSQNDSTSSNNIANETSYNAYSSISNAFDEVAANDEPNEYDQEDADRIVMNMWQKLLRETNEMLPSDRSHLERWILGDDNAPSRCRFTFFIGSETLSAETSLSLLLSLSEKGQRQWSAAYRCSTKSYTELCTEFDSKLEPRKICDLVRRTKRPQMDIISSENIACLTWIADPEQALNWKRLYKPLATDQPTVDTNFNSGLPNTGVNYDLVLDTPFYTLDPRRERNQTSRRERFEAHKRRLRYLTDKLAYTGLRERIKLSEDSLSQEAGIQPEDTFQYDSIYPGEGYPQWSSKTGANEVSAFDVECYVATLSAPRETETSFDTTAKIPTVHHNLPHDDATYEEQLDFWQRRCELTRAARQKQLKEKRSQIFRLVSSFRKTHEKLASALDSPETPVEDWTSKLLQSHVRSYHQAKEDGFAAVKGLFRGKLPSPRDLKGVLGLAEVASAMRDVLIECNIYTDSDLVLREQFLGDLDRLVLILDEDLRPAYDVCTGVMWDRDGGGCTDCLGGVTDRDDLLVYFKDLFQAFLSGTDMDHRNTALDRHHPDFFETAGMDTIERSSPVFAHDPASASIWQDTCKLKRLVSVATGAIFGLLLAFLILWCSPLPLHQHIRPPSMPSLDDTARLLEENYVAPLTSEGIYWRLHRFCEAALGSLREGSICSIRAVEYWILQGAQNKEEEDFLSATMRASRETWNAWIAKTSLLTNIHLLQLCLGLSPTQLDSSQSNGLSKGIDARTPVKSKFSVSDPTQGIQDIADAFDEITEDNTINQVENETHNGLHGSQKHTFGNTGGAELWQSFEPPPLENFSAYYPDEDITMSFDEPMLDSVSLANTMAFGVVDIQTVSCWQS